MVKTEFNVVITLINSNNSINKNKLGALERLSNLSQPQFLHLHL